MNDTAHHAPRIAVRDLDVAAPPETQIAPGAIGPGRRVTLHFALQLENGEEIDTNFGKNPVTFGIGDGSMLPGFEQALFGLVAGDRHEATLAPEQAFGQTNEDNVQRFPLYQFPPDLVLATGVLIEFADATGNKQAGMVRSADKSWVEVDFNHPLAGRSIRFRVHVHKVEQVPQA